MKNYINGVLYGIKISVKIISRFDNTQECVTELCKLQQELKNVPMNNIQLWKNIESILNKYEQ